ncbi:Uncharacterized protein Rs2_37626 [Raphanus sativus]|nr:Uncharacterized protein Rs2_37626 [Raphanus sativus]
MSLRTRASVADERTTELEKHKTMIKTRRRYVDVTNNISSFVSNTCSGSQAHSPNQIYSQDHTRRKNLNRRHRHRFLVMVYRNSHGHNQRTTDNSLQAVWSCSLGERRLISVDVSGDRISVFDTGRGMDSSPASASAAMILAQSLSFHRRRRRLTPLQLPLTQLDAEISDEHLSISDELRALSLSISGELRHLKLSLSISGELRALSRSISSRRALSLSLDPSRRALSLSQSPTSQPLSLDLRALSLDLPISQLISSQALSSPYPSRARPNPSLPFLVEALSGFSIAFSKQTHLSSVSHSLVRLLYKFLSSLPQLELSLSSDENPGLFLLQRNARSLSRSQTHTLSSLFCQVPPNFRRVFSSRLRRLAAQGKLSKALSPSPTHLKLALHLSQALDLLSFSQLRLVRLVAAGFSVGVGVGVSNCVKLVYLMFVWLPPTLTSTLTLTPIVVRFEDAGN